jgi:hypothetical protein
MRNLPPIRQELMRHENIQTTLRYYVGQNAVHTPEAVWAAFSSQNRDSFGNTARMDGENAAAGGDANSFQAMS